MTMKNNIDFQKYDRIFAFGCSFTHYAWPTWADLIAVENEKAEYCNYGHGGYGNLAIACKIAEANVRHDFTDRDLIIIMWSTFCREDRWVNGKWMHEGNVWHSSYPNEWVKEYADPMGYLIRDHAIIYLTHKMLYSLPCDTLRLRSTPLIETELAVHVHNPKQAGQYLKTITSLYGRYYNMMPEDLCTYLGGWNNAEQIQFLEDDNDGNPYMRTDMHPSTGVYYDYLTDAVGVQLSNKTKEFALESDYRLRKCRTRSDIMNAFDSLLSDRQSHKYKNLF